MCGIAGILNKSDFSADRSLSSVEKMLIVSEHRGPDAKHVKAIDNCFLGHTRLSIIDLSAQADQPMSYMNLTIVFNGEIYNYIEIRARLSKLGYEFTTQSDTEVLLKAYHNWGSDCLSHLNGMFAFIIFNSATKSLFIARDRVGEKPLYYAQDEQAFYFASEIKQLIKTGLVAAKMNIPAIEEYLVMQYTLGANTFFSGIYKLMPGHYMEIKDNVVEIKCYWSVDTLEIDRVLDKKSKAKELQSTLEDAIRIRLRSDVPLGCYLSSGIDSTIISSVSSEISQKKLTTYTFSSDNPAFDETPLAAKTAEKISSNNKISQMNIDNFMGLWKKCTYLMDEPVVGYSLIPQYIMSQKVAEHTTVVLGGQGGDELFFGYGWHSALLMISAKDLAQKGLKSTVSFLCNYFNLKYPLELYRKLRQLLKLSWFDFTKSYYKLWSLNTCEPILKKGISEKVYIKFTDVFDLASDVSPLNKVRKFEFKYWLPSLLHVEDRSSMGASIESRCPLLDHRFVECSLSVSASHCIDGNINKLFLRESFDKKIPSWISSKKNKSGYTVPLNDWLKTPAAQAYISSCHQGEKRNLLENFLPSGFDLNQYSVRQIWMLVSVVIWAEEFGILGENN